MLCFLYGKKNNSYNCGQQINYGFNTMPKLTVFFKDKEIGSYKFGEGMARIGRDETNDIIIDSLAIAPVHAVFVFRSDGCTVKQLNDNFTVSLNGRTIKESALQHRDGVIIGKHRIVYTTEETTPEELVRMKKPFANDAQEQLHETLPEPGPDNEDVFKTGPELPHANLQIMDGENIGKVIPIRKTMVQVGRSGSGIIVISKRKDGYFASTLENTGTITVNDQPLSNKIVKLNDNDLLSINDIVLQFFLS